MNQCVRYFLLFHLTLLGRALSYRTGCSIEPSTLGDKQPIILNKKLDFFYPESGNEIFLSKNDDLIVSCIDEGNYESNLKRTFYNVTCVGGETFLSEGQAIQFKDLKCKRPPKFKARIIKEKCGTSFEQIEIGFDLDNRFVRVLMICFDPVWQTTIYSHFHLTKLIYNAQNTGRIPWINNFFQLKGATLDKIYSKKHQKKHINSLLELPPSSSEIVKDDNLHYLARGHLTAKADVYYAHQQRMTFFSVNAAPQWQSFNNGNWKILEMAIRKLTTRRNIDLEIYTGTYEILEMTSRKTKSKTKLFLFGTNETRVLPVPLFFWKIVFDSNNSAGVAFICVNNPYITRDELSSFQICDIITEKIKWVKFKDNLDLGYCYACRLREFLRIVQDAPHLTPGELLE